MSSFRKRITRTTAAAFAAQLITACGSNADDSTEADNSAAVTGGTIVDLQNFAAGSPSHIDPALAEDIQSSQIAALVFEGLTKVDNEGRVTNAVAESFTSNDDLTVHTFKLRKDAKFDNGDTVMPSDFAYAWDRVVDPALAPRAAGQLGIIKGADAVNGKDVTHISGVVADDAKSTLTVTLNSPFPDFPQLVSLPVFSPVPQKLKPAADWEKGVMVGNGPFKMAEPWKDGQYIKLARNDSYYGDKTLLDGVEFRISQSIGSAYTASQTGAGQVGRIPPGSFKDASAQYRENVINTPLMGVEYWGFNMKDPVIGGESGKKLREAIAAAIDRKDIVDKVYNGSRSVATGFAPPSTPGYERNGVNEGRDLGKAKSLLAEWGKTPPTIKISFNSEAGHDDKAAIIKQNLVDAGIPAEVNPLPMADYRRGVQSGSLQFFRFSWNADYVSYDNMLAPSFSTETIGQDDVTGYSNPAVDALFKKARSERELNKRTKIYQDAEGLILGDQPVVPVDWTSAGLVISSQVRGLEVKQLGHVDYAEAWLVR